MKDMSKKIALLFEKAQAKVEVSAAHGSVVSVEKENDARWIAEFKDEMVAPGPYATRVTVCADEIGFSFFLRDVCAKAPIYIPEYGVAVTEADDKRSYEQVAGDITSIGGKSNLEKIDEAPEVSFESCIEGNRELKSPAWLGITRDVRMFEIGIRDYCAETWDCVTPRYFGDLCKDDEIETPNIKYCFMTGRGIGCESNIERRLEDGILPILNSVNTDNDIVYETQYFATNEFSPLDEAHVEGTDMLVADAHGAGHMLTPEQQAREDELEVTEKAREAREEVVMYIRVRARNTAKAPRYAYVRIPDPLPGREYMRNLKFVPRYDGDNGFGILTSGRVYLVATLNGRPVPHDEMNVLVQAGEEIEYVFKIPHSPISHERAVALAKEDYSERYEECKRFWYSKLAKSAEIHVPEQRIDEMIRAGLLHTDVVYFGREPDEAVVPAIGVYTAIGSESSSAIQFLDSVANHKLAERALQYFIEKQHDDGFIQNFGGYMLETGYALWSMGQHYLYTRDDEWAKRVSKNVIAACEYNLRWREDNLDESLRGNGYGMISGKVADPDDMFHSFALNSGAYAGFVGASKLLEKVDPASAEKYGKLAVEYRENIIESLKENLVNAPVVPLGNGKWVPSFPAWTENPGALSLYAEGGVWYSHGTSIIRDIIGTQYVFLHGVIDCHDELAGMLENYLADYICARNVVFSQPYYSPHPYINLMRGNVKAFISEFYNNFSGLADRGTYSFWEHYFHASPHKLHEEGWFLMRCRWMLWLEDNDDLRLLAGIPRDWMTDGKVISAEGVKSLFGKLSFRVESKLSEGRVVAKVRLEHADCGAPKRILLRLPHPDETVRAKSVSIGSYCDKCECVVLECGSEPVSEFEVELRF